VGFEITKESYAGGIKEITIGKGDKAMTVGGETCYPFYQFEGEIPNRPMIAMEVWDMEPPEWPEAALAPFRDVITDPAAWAKKCVDEFKAQAIVLQLKSIDPNDKDAGPEEAAETVKKVLAAIDVPLILWGCTAPAKDEEVFKKIAEECQGKNLIIGPVEEKNYKGIGAAAMGYGHTIISSSPIDVNLAKQVNILLENLGMPLDKVIVDPTTGGLGYGMEYSYSVMERLAMAAMSQGDDKLQNPMINNLANEVWKCKEAKLTVEEEPLLGDPEKRAILMESIGAVAYLMAGSNILIMRHPESIRLAKTFIDLIMDGGSAMDIGPIEKRLDDVDIDFAALAPEPDLTIEEEASTTQKAAPAKAEPKTEAKPVAKAEPKPSPAAKKEAKPAATPVKNEKPVAAAKAKAEADAEAKAEAKAKADAEAKVKAEAEAKAKIEAEKQAAKDAAAKREAEEQALREKREAEVAKHAAEHTSAQKAEIKKTAAKTQLSKTQKLLKQLRKRH